MLDAPQRGLRRGPGRLRGQLRQLAALLAHVPALRRRPGPPPGRAVRHPQTATWSRSAAARATSCVRCATWATTAAGATTPPTRASRPAATTRSPSSPTTSPATWRSCPTWSCSRHVLEHLVDPAPLFDSVRRSAESSTILYVEVPDAAYVLTPAGLWDLIYPHVGYYTAAALRHLVDPVGLRAARGGHLVRQPVPLARGPGDRHLRRRHPGSGAAAGRGRRHPGAGRRLRRAAPQDDRRVGRRARPRPTAPASTSPCGAPAPRA